jgi:hypothetical protein
MDTGGSRRAKRWTYTHKKVVVKVLEIESAGYLGIQVCALKVTGQESEIIVRHLLAQVALQRLHLVWLRVQGPRSGTHAMLPRTGKPPRVPLANGAAVPPTSHP